MAAPNRNKNDRTIVPGIWADCLRTYDSLPAGRLAVTTLTQTEIAILEGDFFRTFELLTIPGTSSVYMLFTAPPDTVRFGLRFREITPSQAGLWYRVYSNPTGVVTTGSPWPIFNENGLSSKTSGSVFQNVSSFTTPGTLSDIAYNPPSATGQKISGSLAREEGFKIVSPDAQLLIEFENLANQTNEVLVYYQWIEAPAAIASV